ncbi:MAG: hypothetical protein PHC64_08970 [Candidatus Gastranaerophilales bacterium]|nr:hypothetical protein [Candidatus Gastranaerophilales bacterium]
MPVSLNTVISAFDTPSSLTPFVVKDIFDVTGRTVMAQNEGGKHEAREKFIEEAGTSLFWICGIPGVIWLANKLYKHKIDPKIHFKRINTEGIQSYYADELIKTAEEGKPHRFSAQDLEGIQLGGKKLGKIKDKLKKAGFKPNETKGFYGKYHKGVTAAAVLINLAILSVAIPQLNLYLSRKIISKEANGKNGGINKTPYDTLLFGNNKPKSMNHFLGKVNSDQNKEQSNGKKPSFGSIKDLFKFKEMIDFASKAEVVQLEPVSGMLLLDWGISGNRVIITPRNTNERVENIVKEGGIIFFFYYAAEVIKNGLAKLANKVFNVPIDLDYKVINNPEFLAKLRAPHNQEELLSFAPIEDPEAEIPKHLSKDKREALIAQRHSANEVSVIKMIDKELAKTSKGTPKEEVFKNFTLRMAQREGLIAVEYDDELGKWIRHSKKYIETEKVIVLNDNLRTFYEKALAKIGKADLAANIERIISKTKRMKIAAIFANMAICCTSVSYIIPKIQYMIREHRTQTKEAPGIKHYQEKAAKNELKV